MISLKSYLLTTLNTYKSTGRDSIEIDKVISWIEDSCATDLEIVNEHGRVITKDEAEKIRRSGLLSLINKLEALLQDKTITSRKDLIDRLKEANQKQEI